MSSCNHNCSDCKEHCNERKESLIAAQNDLSHVKKVIGVVSGKGGVGKSMVTGMLAVTLARAGLKTAVLDADITGPSVPKMFGVTEKAYGDGKHIFPAVTPCGTKIMSVNLMLENDTDPVLWRGPVIAGTVKQFWQDVAWGDVDFMFVDMPPGTGDVALTVFQSLPLDGIVVVTSPQDLVSMIVGKAVKMAEMMKVPVLALVENMSYFECPTCKTRHSIFGESHLDELAEGYGIDTVCRLPISPSLAVLADNGAIESLGNGFVDDVARKILSLK